MTLWISRLIILIWSIGKISTFRCQPTDGNLTIFSCNCLFTDAQSWLVYEAPFFQNKNVTFFKELVSVYSGDVGEPKKCIFTSNEHVLCPYNLYRSKFIRQNVTLKLTEAAGGKVHWMQYMLNKYATNDCICNLTQSWDTEQTSWKKLLVKWKLPIVDAYFYNEIASSQTYVFSNSKIPEGSKPSNVGVYSVSDIIRQYGQPSMWICVKTEINYCSDQYQLPKTCKNVTLDRDLLFEHFQIASSSCKGDDEKAVLTWKVKDEFLEYPRDILKYQINIFDDDRNTPVQTLTTASKSVTIKQNNIYRYQIKQCLKNGECYEFSEQGNCEIDTSFNNHYFLILLAPLAVASIGFVVWFYCFRTEHAKGEKTSDGHVDIEEIVNPNYYNKEVHILEAISPANVYDDYGFRGPTLEKEDSFDHLDI